jgi:hypothetical protein
MTLGARCAAEAPEGVSISPGRTCGFAAKIFGSADPDREGSPGSRSPARRTRRSERCSSGCCGRGANVRLGGWFNRESLA